MAGVHAAPGAASDRLKYEKAWAPRFAALEDIVRTAFAWHQAHRQGYGGR